MTKAASSDGTTFRSQPTAADVVAQRLDVGILTRSRLVFIGLGGVGLFLARGLGPFLAGLCRSRGSGELFEVWFVDGKAFSDRHTFRLDAPDLLNKAEAVSRELLDRHGCHGLAVRFHTDFVRPDNIQTLVRDGDCVLLAVDNHATRNLVSRYCSDGRLDNVVLISGGNDGVEEGLRGTYGNVQVYVRRRGVDQTAPLHHFHPEISSPADHSPADVGCDESGVPQITITNMFTATIMAATLLRLLMPQEAGQPYDEVSFDVFEAKSQPLWLGQ